MCSQHLGRSVSCFHFRSSKPLCKLQAGHEFDLATWCPCERPLGSHLQAKHHPARLLHLLLQLLLVGVQLLLPGPLLLRCLLPQGGTQPTENNLSCSHHHQGLSTEQRRATVRQEARFADHSHNSFYLGAAQ